MEEALIKRIMPNSLEAEQAISRFIELKYLDDYAYAQEFVRTRLNTNFLSRKYR